ncbi:MAG: hypothetical protein LBR26_13240 [Prevotella sp.]|jgi:NCAIR mutase (PurE)-related protein|nr:hypothetical protein [Prevotella sp.]
MKFYVVIFAFFLSAVFSCHSSKNRNSSFEVLSESASNVLSTRKDSASSYVFRCDSMADITAERQYIRTIWYRPDGSIQAVQDNWRGADRTGVAVSHTGSSDVSVAEQTTDSASVTGTQTKETVSEDSKTDYRLVQGTEWLWVAGAFVLAVAGFGFWKYKKSC